MAPRNPQPESTNVTEYSVSELAFALKRTVEDAYGLVRLRGEVSGYRGPHASGHCYFRLKDENAAIEAVVWRGTFSRLKFKPEEGLEIVAKGKITTYPGGSKYQIVIEDLEPAGAGALMALLEQRKKQLAAEGLFDEERKQELPFLPDVIGVVTSPTGAVIRDILHRLGDRFPSHVIVWPVRVQGDTCAADVAAAIAGFNAGAATEGIVPDLIIVARGGGSLEDLWGFNEEIVVRAAAASAIPLISAVGHETDWTLIDLVADYRAPTPTAAAERAVPVRSELLSAVQTYGVRMAGTMRRAVEHWRSRVTASARGLPAGKPFWACRASGSIRRVVGFSSPCGRTPRAIGPFWRVRRLLCGRASSPPRRHGTRLAQAPRSGPCPGHHRSCREGAPAARCAGEALGYARLSQRPCARICAHPRRGGRDGAQRRRRPCGRGARHSVLGWPYRCPGVGRHTSRACGAETEASWDGEEKSQIEP